MHYRHSFTCSKEGGGSTIDFEMQSKLKGSEFFLKMLGLISALERKRRFLAAMHCITNQFSCIKKSNYSKFDQEL